MSIQRAATRFKADLALVDMGPNLGALMPPAQEANKPMFKLKPADGAFGGHMRAALECYREFRDLARKIEDRIGLADDGGDLRG